MFKPQRVLLIFSFLILSITTNIDCMRSNNPLLKPDMPGVKRSSDAVIIEIINEGLGEKYDDFLKRPDVKILQKEKYADRFGLCMVAAITDHLGIFGKAPQFLPLAYGDDLITECKVLDKYYKQVGKPETDNLVVFTDDNHRIHHLAIITSVNKDEMRAKSKRGTKHELIESRLFDGTTIFETNAFFYRLEEPFKSDRQLMLKNINDDLRASQRVKEDILYARTLYLQLANGKDVKHKIDDTFNMQSTPKAKIWHLLKTCMGLKIDTVNQTGKTPLMLAASRGDAGIVGMLLTMNANVNKQDTGGNTALHFASKCHNGDDATFALLQYGAKVEVKNNNHEYPIINEQVNSHLNGWNTVLMSLVLGKTLAVEELTGSDAGEQLQSILDSHGTNLHLNMKFKHGLTLLMAAVGHNNIEGVKILLNHGVDKYIKDNDGCSAYDYAQESENEELKQLFQ